MDDNIIANETLPVNTDDEFDAIAIGLTYFASDFNKNSKISK